MKRHVALSVALCCLLATLFGVTKAVRANVPVSQMPPMPSSVPQWQPGQIPPIYIINNMAPLYNGGAALSSNAVTMPTAEQLGFGWCQKALDKTLDTVKAWTTAKVIGYSAAFVGCVAYGVLLTKLLRAGKDLPQEDEENLATWHNDITNDALEKLPPHEVALALLEHLGSYAESDNTSRQPLVLFLELLRSEMSTIEHFLSLRACVQKTRLCYILPAQADAVSRATAQKRRLLYLEKILCDLLLEYAQERKTTAAADSAAGGG